MYHAITLRKSPKQIGISQATSKHPIPNIEINPYHLGGAFNPSETYKSAFNLDHHPR
jgi:hypothetical protein